MLCAVHRTQEKNYPILNQIYDILAELQNQEKIIVCNVSALIGIKGNEIAD